MFAERFERARLAAGLSMAALGQEVGVSANAIKKYAHGDAMPSSANLLKLARALGVRTEYFFRPMRVPIEGVEYRKRAVTSKKLLRQVNADVLEQAERWLELLDFFPDNAKPLPAFELPQKLPVQVASMTEVDTIAMQLRDAWQLGRDAIPSLVDVLEAHGIMVIITQVDTGKCFDGLAGRTGDTPIIVISAYQPGDRQRFTLAHELGHLVLHQRLSKALDEEKACHRFASAFLLPDDTLLAALGSRRQALEMGELYSLKQEYGISMMAILYRAGQAGIISKSKQKQYFMHFSAQGWRTQEPGSACLQEETRLLGRLVYRALAEGFIGEAKAAELMGMPLHAFHQQRKLESMDAVAHQ